MNTILDSSREESIAMHFDHVEGVHIIAVSQDSKRKLSNPWPELK